VIAKVEWILENFIRASGSLCEHEAERVVAFYNKRGTCEQSIQARQRRDQVDAAVPPTFAANAARLQLRALPYNLGNFLRTLATPEPIKGWSLTSFKAS
jgi:hypothetical protein